MSKTSTRAQDETEGETTREEALKQFWGATKRAGRSKYGVDLSAKGKEDRTFQGILYASKHEMEVYRDYVLPNEHVGVFRNVRRQVTYQLHAWTPGGFKVKVGTWRADWVASDREGRPVVIDAKGARTKIYELKKAIFEAEYGLRILEL